MSGFLPGFLPCLLLGTGLLLQGQAPSALPEALTAHLKTVTLLHADFTQTRTLAALSRPLKATGSLVLSRDQGVIWQVRKPLSLCYVITPGGIKEFGPDGTAKPKGAKDGPVVAQIGRILQSLLQGKWSALDDYFTIRAEGRPEAWKINLAPKPQTAAFLKGIQLSGGRTIDRVILQEPGGDRMELAFERPRTQDPLTEAESRLFARD